MRGSTPAHPPPISSASSATSPFQGLRFCLCFFYNVHAMRTDWTRPEISALYHQPLLDLLWKAQQVHREFHPANQVQMCRLLSIKTGGCPEDCAYCPQSAHYPTGVERQALMDTDQIL